MSTNLIDVLKKAEEKSGKNILQLVKKEEDEGELLDLAQFKVEEKTPEELEAERKEVERRDQWCRSAAPLVLKIRKRINEIAIAVQAGPLSISLQAELDKLHKDEAALLAAGGDEALSNHLNFSVFLDEIRTAPVNKETALIILNKIVELGRYSILPREEAEEKKKEWREGEKIPQGVQIFWGRVYLPYEPALGEVKSNGQKALESVLGQYMYRVRKVERKRK